MEKREHRKQKGSVAGKQEKRGAGERGNGEEGRRMTEEKEAKLEQKKRREEESEKVQKSVAGQEREKATQKICGQKFFTIKEVSEQTGLSISALRYYDREGLTPQIVRNVSGVRQYTGEDVCWIELICCLKHSGMALEDIRRFMELCLEGEEAAEKRREVLLKQKELLEQQIKCLQCSLELIGCKLEHYREIGIFHFGENV